MAPGEAPVQPGDEWGLGPWLTARSRSHLRRQINGIIRTRTALRQCAVRVGRADLPCFENLRAVLSPPPHFAIQTFRVTRPYCAVPQQTFQSSSTEAGPRKQAVLSLFLQHRCIGLVACAACLAAGTLLIVRAGPCGHEPRLGRPRTGQEIHAKGVAVICCQKLGSAASSHCCHSFPGGRRAPLPTGRHVRQSSTAGRVPHFLQAPAAMPTGHRVFISGRCVSQV